MARYSYPGYPGYSIIKLVVSIPLKHMSSSMGTTIPDMKWKIKVMFESTNQIYNNIIAITIETSIYKGYITDIITV